MAERIFADEGARLKAGRLAAGITQKAAAQALGVAQPQLSAYEKGVRLPTLDKVRILEALYGTSFGADVPDTTFERGFAAGEFAAIGDMAEGIADRARQAAARLRQPETTLPDGAFEEAQATVAAGRAAGARKANRRVSRPG